MNRETAMRSTMKQYTDNLRQPAVMQSTKQELLNALGNPQEVIQVKTLKKFQLAYMIVYQTANVMENANGALEQATLNAAVPMLETFERIRATGQPDAAAFRSLFSAYIERFDAFTAVDIQRLITRLQ